MQEKKCFFVGIETFCTFAEVKRYRYEYASIGRTDASYVTGTAKPIVAPLMAFGLAAKALELVPMLIWGVLVAVGLFVLCKAARYLTKQEIGYIIINILKNTMIKFIYL